MAIDPQFIATPVIGIGQISAANTNRDGTGTLVTVLTGATNGTVIEKIEAKATGTTTSGIVRLFIYDGTNTRLWQEILVSAITPSGTVDTWQGSIVLSNPFVLPANYQIRASTHNAETFNMFVFGGSY